MSALPEDFLSSPAPNISVNRIDFSKTTLPGYAGLYAITIDNVLSIEECQPLVAAAEATTNGEWERAMINIGGVAKNLVVAKVWQRIEHLSDVQEIVQLEGVPAIFGNGPAKRGEVWKFSRPNERMRFLKYVGGEYFRPHCDGSYETPDRKERTYFTLHLYLNNAGTPTKGEISTMSSEERKNMLIGGATTFHSIDMNRAKDFDVLPKTGCILLFQHRDLLHSGDDVVCGVKYTMRTDLLYSLESTKSQTKGKMPMLDDD